MNDEINEKEDVIIESEIALEDGEIEEEESTVAVEVVETTMDVRCVELEVVETEVVNDGSDLDISDQFSAKSKKHKHHKKSIHRKRQLSTDEISVNDSVKKIRNNEEFNESTPPRDVLPQENDDYCRVKEISVEKCSWNHESDNEDFNAPKGANQKYKNVSPIREEKRFVENIEKPVRIEENDIPDVNSPVMKEKWGCDSDEEDSKPAENKQVSISGNNDWCNNDGNKNSWDNKSDAKTGWGNKNDEEKGWKNKDKGWGEKDNDNKGWGNKNDDDKGWGNKNDEDKGWGNKDEEKKGWGNNNDDDKGWGNKDNDNKGWGNRNDSGRSDWRNRDEGNNNFGNRRGGGRNNWGDRNDDRGNRGFRNRGRGNWRNRNDDDSGGGRGNWRNRNDDDNGGGRGGWRSRNDDDNGGGRNRGRNDWGNNRRDNNSWGNKNDDNNSWDNKNKDNNSWSNTADDNNSNKNDDNASWKNKDNDTWGNKEDDKQEWKAPTDNSDMMNIANDVEVVEKQAWGATSDDEDSSPGVAFVSRKPLFKSVQDSFFPDKAVNSFSNDDENEIKNSEVNIPIQSRDIDDFGKWGSFDGDEEDKKPKEATPISKQNNFESATVETSVNRSSPVPAARWGFDSDDEAGVSKPSTFVPQSNFKDDDKASNFNRNDSTGNKWSSPNQGKTDQPRNSFSKWGNEDSDEDNKNNSRGQNNDDNDRGNYNSFNKNNQRNNYNNNRGDSNNRGDYNNRGDNNQRGDNNNNRGRGGGGGKRWPCKYFMNGSCRHGDNCNFIHDSPVKGPAEVVNQSEPKIYELCRFYEHQECYNRSTCVLMHEEFPCKLFHAGSKMCPSGDGCKYSHAPLNPETRAMLEKYLDEKIDERTDKSASGSINDNSDYKTNLSLPPPVDEIMHDPYRMYPPIPDLMKIPVRPWNQMMPFGDMPLPPQMDYMQRQRFLFERFPQAMPGRIMPGRGFRGMPGPMHDPYNINSYPVSPMMPVYGNPKGMQEMKERINGSDPFLDNLAQMVVGPKETMKRDIMDHNDDADEYSNNVENDCKKRSMLSPVKINSPEVPPGAYVPRNSMNAVQPNVRLGSGVPYGGNEAPMMFGGFPGHPNDPAMMDYINMAAIHYYHNQNDSMNYDRPWKLIVLDVPSKIPYPLMNIDTQELPHKYIDPRLKGHPSVLNSSHSSESSAMIQRDHSHDFSISSIGSQLSSPAGLQDCTDMERQLSFTGYRTDLESPLFAINEESFTFLGADDSSKRVLDRSYLQDPRFKRKKVNTVSPADQTEVVE